LLFEKVDQVTGMISQQLERSIVSKHNSSVKGKLFEQQLMDDVQHVFRIISDFSFQDTSKISASGDFVTSQDGFSIMWEAKSYARTVEAREVTKFLRDLILRRDVRVGVLVSSTSAVSDGKQVFHAIHTFEHEQKLVVLVPFYETFSSMSLAVVKLMINVWISKQSKSSLTESNHDQVVKRSQKLLD